MTQEITRSFDIDVGHRLLRHEGKCRSAHGHRYTVEVSCKAVSRLDDVGRVIDFSVVKDEVGGWLDRMFDHGFVIQQGDPLEEWLDAHDQKHQVLDCPPSIENLTREWFDGAATLLAVHGIVVTKVRGYETAKCWAEYTMADAERDRTIEVRALAAREEEESDE